jgi:hypothetical protein
VSYKFNIQSILGKSTFYKCLRLEYIEYKGYQYEGKRSLSPEIFAEVKVQQNKS